jgi:hypothetical protein
MEEIGEEAVEEDRARGIHPHCNGKSAESIERKRVAGVHCAKESGSRSK